MSWTINKDGISASFSKAASTYDNWSEPQKLIAEHLETKLPLHLPEGNIIDLGCGTGLLTKMLSEAYPDRHIRGVDLAPGMINICKKKWNKNGRLSFEIADAENFDPGREPSCLIASSCTFQWFENQPEAIKRTFRLLSRGGYLAVAVPVKGTLAELQSSYKETFGKVMMGLNYRDEKDYEELFKGHNAVIRHYEIKSFKVHYSSGLQVFKSFKGVGAVFNGHKGFSPLSRKKLVKLISNYEETHMELPVTYKVLFLVVESMQ